MLVAEDTNWMFLAVEVHFAVQKLWDMGWHMNGYTVDVLDLYQKGVYLDEQGMSDPIEQLALEVVEASCQTRRDVVVDSKEIVWMVDRACNHMLAACDTDTLLGMMDINAWHVEMHCSCFEDTLGMDSRLKLDLV